MKQREGVGKFRDLVERRRVDMLFSVDSHTYVFFTAKITVTTIMARGPVIPNSIPTGGKNPEITPTMPPIGCGGVPTMEPIISLSVTLGGWRPTNDGTCRVIECLVESTTVSIHQEMTMTTSGRFRRWIYHPSEDDVFVLYLKK